MAMTEAKSRDSTHVESVADIKHELHENATQVGQLKSTRYMVVFAVFIGLSGWIYNFDLGYSGIVLLMQPYNRAFGTCGPRPDGHGGFVDRCTLTATQQSLISLSIIFIGIGSFMGGQVGHYLGRRGTIQFGCAIIAVGAGGMLGTSGNFVAYMACKCIQAVGLGHLLAAVPPYGVECVAAEKRGFLMALFNIGLGFGNMVAAAVCLASSRLTTNASWQTPIACQIPLTLLLGGGVLFFPESPRWLLTKGREDAARRSFAKFYSKQPDSPEITAQVNETLHYLELERNLGAVSNWTEVFRGTDLRRTLTSTLIATGVAITGSKFFSTYAAIFLAGVGIKNPYHITLSLASCACVGGLVSPWIIEYLGRRLALLAGYGAMATCMLIVGAVGSALGDEARSVQISVIVFLCLWGVVYGGFIGTSLSTTTAEMHAVRLRTYGQAVSIGLYEMFSFASSFSTPYMLNVSYGNMGLNVGYFFAGLTVIVWILIFFMVPETGRLTLEDIDDIFISKTKPWKTSLAKNKRKERSRQVEE